MQTFGQRIAERPEGMYVPIEFPEFALLDTETRDKRTIMADGFAMDDPPRTLYFQRAQAPGHDGAVAIGRIDAMGIEGDLVTASGWIVDTPDGRLAAHLVKTGVLRGNSVDLGVRDRDVIIDVSWDEETDTPQMSAKFRNASVTASTLVGKPAFQNAAAVIPDGWDVEGVSVSDADARQVLAATGARHSFEFATSDQELLTPAALFTDPQLEGPTPLYVQDDGEVYGHIAAWGTRHLDSGLVPPHSQSGYAYFATGAVHTSDGGIVPTGRLVIDANHAAEDLGWRKAVDHYANTAAAWADVAVGEDGHGVWVAGQVRPGTSERVVRAARNSAMSGDWRLIAGHMELIAALSVNAGAFPIPRSHAYGTGTAIRTLLSAGALAPETGSTLRDREFQANIAVLADEARKRRVQALRMELELADD